jgi:nitroreductase
MFTTRRSIRRYKSTEIEEDKLQRVLEAARWAPSWANTQCCDVIVIKDAGMKKRLAEILSPKNPATIAMEKAPIVVAVCGELKKSGYYNDKAVTRLGDWFMYDLGLATQNICMAAHNEGLGTVIVGAFDHDGARQILGLPLTHQVVALLPLGYPDHEPPVPKRKPMEKFVHWERF